MMTPPYRHVARAALAFAVALACARPPDADAPPRDTADTAGATADSAALSPRALGSLEGSCPTGGAAPRTGSRGTYENELDRGEFLLLRVAGEVVDSIDAAFGVHVVGTDSLIFIPIYTDTTGSFPFTPSIGEPILCAAGERVLLRRILPELDALFSSPAVRDSTIWYWGLRQLGQPGRYFLTARRHHFPTGRADSLALDSIAMYTDARHHLRTPRIVGDSVVYEVEGKRWAWARPAEP